MVEENKINFKYVFSDNYNPVYVNGVFGGITPRGEIVINFFLERHALPKSQSYEIKDGFLGKELESCPQDLKSSMVRFVSTGIILNYQLAKEFSNWLNSQIESFDKIMKPTEKKEKN